MKVIAVKERSCGDGEGHGDNWVETSIFDIDAPIRAVVEWAQSITADGPQRALKYGRLMLTIADESIAKAEEK